MSDNSNGHDDSDNVVRIPTLKERDRQCRKQEKQWRKDYKKQHYEPFINLPPVTKALVFVFLIIHVVTDVILDPVQQYWLFEHFGFVPSYYIDGLNGKPLWVLFTGPFTYIFLHGNWMHVILNTVMLMAFGTGVERWLGARRFIIFFVLCSLGAVLFHTALNPHSSGPVVGASGGLSGLFAAVLFMFYQQGRIKNGKYGLLPVILLWVVISVLFGVLGGPGGETIAWAAHIGGFLAGFVFIKPVLRIK